MLFWFVLCLVLTLPYWGVGIWYGVKRRTWWPMLYLAQIYVAVTILAVFLLGNLWIAYFLPIALSPFGAALIFGSEVAMIHPGFAVAIAAIFLSVTAGGTWLLNRRWPYLGVLLSILCAGFLAIAFAAQVTQIAMARQAENLGGDIAWQSTTTEALRNIFVDWRPQRPHAILHRDGIPHFWSYREMNWLSCADTQPRVC